jgi:dGTPase
MPSTLEGQIVRVSDVIAYVNHDVDDALRAGIIKEEDIPAGLVKVLGKWHATRIDRMVMDVVEASLAAGLERIAMSDRIMKAVVELREFLYQNVYFNSAARDELRKTEKIITDLFGYITERPQEYIRPYPAGDPEIVRVGDFIAGMTDRYAMALYEQVFLPKAWPIL